MFDDHASRWRAAVGGASFVPYEPVGDTIEATWAGGHGGPPGTTGHLEICALRGGVEVSIDTNAMPPHPDPNVRLSMLVQQLIGRHALEQNGIELPYSVTVESDDRQIDVSGRPTMFTGVRIGEATIDGLLIRVDLDGPIDFELHPCPDPNALAHGPPQPDQTQ